MQLLRVRDHCKEINKLEQRVEALRSQFSEDEAMQSYISNRELVGDQYLYDRGGFLKAFSSSAEY